MTKSSLLTEEENEFVGNTAQEILNKCDGKGKHVVLAIAAIIIGEIEHSLKETFKRFAMEYVGNCLNVYRMARLSSNPVQQISAEQKRKMI